MISKIYTIFKIFLQFLGMQQELKQLIEQKDELEKRIGAIDTEIKTINQTKNLQKGLVTDEGFPRQDLDFGEIANYRNLKRQKAQLNNDHVTLMKQIQKQLHKLHEQYPQIEENDQQIKEIEQKNYSPFVKKNVETFTQPQKKQYKIDYLTPFARITSTEQGSPANKFGLQTGDLLSEFSQVTIYTIDNVKQIPKYVKEGLPIKVVILRKTDLTSPSESEDIFKLKDGNYYQKITYELVPQKWSGRGLLGCKIDPLQ